MDAKTFWLTGFSGAGKTTISNELKRITSPMIPIYLLDGDVLRETVCAGLGFSKEDRHENLRRAAGVARILNEAGVNVIAAFVSPYRNDREMLKDIIGPWCFYEIYVETSITECEYRDPKGLYKKARAKEIPLFTGISDPYEPPLAPDFRINTEGQTVNESALLLGTFITQEIYRNR